MLAAGEAFVDPGSVTGSTADRLLDAAERLVAERGVEGVSLRAVNAAAGTNVAAVHYHFGSKDALLEAVMRRRMDRLATLRLAMLRALGEHPSPPVRAVVEALVAPLAELSEDAAGPGRAYVRFLAALRAAGPQYRTLMARAFAPQFAPFDEALARALPHLPTPLRHFRLRIAGDAVVTTLAAPEEAGSTLRGDGAAFEHAEIVAALIDGVTGLLAAPVSDRPRGAPA